MQEHPSLEQLSQYQRRALEPALFLFLHRHINACPKCSEQCSALPHAAEDHATLLSALLPSPDDDAYHLTKAELAAYVSGRSDDVTIELAESHLEVCKECGQVVAELRATSDSTASVEADGNEKAQTFRRNAPSVLPAFLTAQRRPAQIAALVLLLLGAGLIALFFVRSLNRQPTPLPPGERMTGVNDNGSNQSPSPGTIPNANEQQAQDQSNKGQNAVGPDAGSPIKNDDAISPSLQRAIRLAWTTQTLERPEVLAQLKGVPSQLLGDPGNGIPFPLLSPAGKVVESRSPTFRWRGLEGAGNYVVTIVDNRLEAVASSGPITETSWSIPVPLKRGATYSWQVTALKGGRRITSPVLPAPQVKFKILDQEHNEELVRMKRLLPDYHLGLGVFYMRAGLLDEAEQEFQALAQQNPGSAPAARLLESVRAMKE